MLYLVLGFMALCAAALVARPFFTRVAIAQAPSGVDALRAEGAAIDDALARGDLDRASADAARIDAERRFLRDDVGAAPQATAMSGANKLAAAITAAFVLVGAGGIYAVTTNPDTPLASEQAADPEAQARTELAQLIAQIEAKLKEEPANPEGWRALGWAQFLAGDYGASKDAYARAIQLAPERADLRSAYGETLVAEAEGTVSPEARTAFGEALKHDAADVRARFYLGLAKAQDGDARAALDDWIKLYGEAPPGSEGAQELRMRIETLAAESKIDVSGRLPAAPRGPSAADVQAAEQMSDADRDAMIESMVSTLDARLRQNPRDLEGWMRLINARIVQGKTAEAMDALTRARAAFKGDAEAQRQLDQAEAAIALP
jgi:cytochrome c-type biogenesis protein CcmH